MGLVAVIVASLFAQGMHTYSAGQAAGLVIADVRFAVEQIATRLREADPGSVTIAADGSRITFRVRGTPLTYHLYRPDIRLNDQPMASYVQSLRFEHAITPTGEAVMITATTVSSVSGARPGTGLPFTFTTRAVLRN